MPLLPVEKAVGHALARPLITADGRLMLQANVVLGPADVAAIQRRLGLRLVDVRSGILPDVALEDADIAVEARAEATRALAHAMQAITARARPPRAGPLLAAASAILDATLSLDGAIVALVTMRTQDDALLQHGVNTAINAVLIGLGRGLRREALLALSLGGMLHDLGKALLAPAILTKPGRLNPDEVAQIQAHPALGHDLIRRDFPKFAPSVADIAHLHHERLDGTGYPRRLTADAIPLLARICTVADVFDALCAVRPYKPGWAPHRAAAYLRRHPEWFDAAVVDLFLRQVALYPSGSLVMTRGRRLALVIGQTRGVPDAPVVLVLAERGRGPVPPYVLDLTQAPDELPIVQGVRRLPWGWAERIDRAAARAAVEAHLSRHLRGRAGEV